MAKYAISYTNKGPDISLKIEAIKELRRVFGFGLKEAKDTVELADMHGGMFDHRLLSDDEWRKLKANLLSFGYTITCNADVERARNEISEHIVKSCELALRNNDFELLSVLVDLKRKYL